jgi:hypothetical protein
MKRLTLVASVCLAGFVLAPIASASAAEKFEGSCTIHGKAKFTKGGEAHKLKETPAKLQYSFKSEGGTTCTALGTTEKKAATAEVKGEGELSCGASVSEGPGPGTLTIGANKYGFNLKFVSGAPGTIVLAVEAEEGGFATGSANFLKSENESAVKCAKEGVFELEFDAEAAGTI